MHMMPQITSPLPPLLLVLSLYFTLVYCTESEAQALLAWRSSLKYPGNLTNMWSDHISTDPCHWDGIRCNGAGSITSIIYDGISDPINGTLAKFNFSLLPNLTEFEFYNNNLHGEIPQTIGNLHNLETLFLHNNSLTGQFPGGILNLSHIELLFLSNNEFTGVIPREILKLSNIRQLGLDCNQFTGEIPMTFDNMS
jgi:Leucine-rich repeat (LRR) protein